MGNDVSSVACECGGSGKVRSDWTLPTMVLFVETLMVPPNAPPPWDGEHLVSVQLDGQEVRGGKLMCIPSGPIEIPSNGPRSKLRLQFYRRPTVQEDGLRLCAELSAVTATLVSFGAPLYMSLWLGLSSAPAQDALGNVREALRRARLPVPKVKITIFRPSVPVHMVQTPSSGVSKLEPNVKVAFVESAQSWSETDVFADNSEKNIHAKIAQVSGLIRCLDESNAVVQAYANLFASKHRNDLPTLDGEEAWLDDIGLERPMHSLEFSTERLFPRAQIEDTFKQVDRLTNELGLLREELEEVHARNAEQNGQLEVQTNMKRSIQELEQALSHEREAHNNQKRRAEELESKLVDEKACRDDLRLRFEQLEKTLANESGCRADLLLQCDKLERTLATEKASRDDLRSQIDELERTLANERACRDDLRSQIDELERTLANERACRDDQGLQIEELERTQANERVCRDDLRSQVEILDKTLASEREGSSEVRLQCEDLVQELANEKERHEGFRLRCEELERTLANKQTAHAEATQRLHDEKAEADKAAYSTNEALAGTVKRLQDELVQLEEQKTKEMEESLATERARLSQEAKELAAILATERESIAQKTDQVLATLDQERHSHAQQLDVLTQGKLDLQRDLDNLREQSDQEIRQLKDHLHKERDAYETRIAGLTEDKLQLQQELDQIGSDMEGKEKKMVEFMRMLEKMQAQHAKRREAISDRATPRLREGSIVPRSAPSLKPDAPGREETGSSARQSSASASGRSVTKAIRGHLEALDRESELRTEQIAAWQQESATIKQLKDEKETLLKEVEQLRAQRTSAGANESELTRLLDGEREMRAEQVAALQRESSQALEYVEVLEQEREPRERKLVMLQGDSEQIDALRRERDKLASDVERLREQLVEHRSDSVEINALEAGKAALRADLERITAEKNELQVSLNQAISTLQTDKAALLADYDRIAAEKETLILTLESSKAAFMVDFDRVTAEKQALDLSSEQDALRIRELQNETTTLQQDLQRTRTGLERELKAMTDSLHVESASNEEHAALLQNATMALRANAGDSQQAREEGSEKDRRIQALLREVGSELEARLQKEEVISQETQVAKVLGDEKAQMERELQCLRHEKQTALDHVMKAREEKERLQEKLMLAEEAATQVQGGLRDILSAAMERDESPEEPTERFQRGEPTDPGTSATAIQEQEGLREALMLAEKFATQANKDKERLREKLTLAEDAATKDHYGLREKLSAAVERAEELEGQMERLQRKEHAVAGTSATPNQEWERLRDARVLAEALATQEQTGLQQRFTFAEQRVAALEAQIHDLEAARASEVAHMSSRLDCYAKAAEAAVLHAERVNATLAKEREDHELQLRTSRGQDAGVHQQDAMRRAELELQSREEMLSTMGSEASVALAQVAASESENKEMHRLAQQQYHSIAQLREFLNAAQGALAEKDQALQSFAGTEAANQHRMALIEVQLGESWRLVEEYKEVAHKAKVAGAARDMESESKASLASEQLEQARRLVEEHEEAAHRAKVVCATRDMELESRVAVASEQLEQARRVAAEHEEAAHKAKAAGAARGIELVNQIAVASEQLAEARRLVEEHEEVAHRAKVGATCDMELENKVAVASEQLEEARRLVEEHEEAARLSKASATLEMELANKAGVATEQLEAARASVRRQTASVEKLEANLASRMTELTERSIDASSAQEHCRVMEGCLEELKEDMHTLDQKRIQELQSLEASLASRSDQLAAFTGEARTARDQAASLRMTLQNTEQRHHDSLQRCEAASVAREATLEAQVAQLRAIGAESTRQDERVALLEAQLEETRRLTQLQQVGVEKLEMALAAEKAKSAYAGDTQERVQALESLLDESRRTGLRHQTAVQHMERELAANQLELQKARVEKETNAAEARRVQFAFEQMKRLHEDDRQHEDEGALNPQAHLANNSVGRATCLGPLLRKEPLSHAAHEQARSPQVRGAHVHTHVAELRSQRHGKSQDANDAVARANVLL